MDLQINKYKVGERPTVTLPNPEFLRILGESGIREMVSKHYDLLRESKLKEMFSRDDAGFERSKQYSADFMIQILGGHEYYNEHRGKPMLVNRHQPFSITPLDRIVWLNCYKQVLLTINAPDYLKESFWNYLNIFSNWMVSVDSGV